MMDHINDPMERVSERVVSRRTLMVTCCGEHVGKHLGGSPLDSNGSVELATREKAEDKQRNNRNTK